MFMAGEHTIKTTVVVVITLITLTSANGVYEWMTADNFDEIIDRMDAVNELNCEAKSREELLLPFGTVSNIVKTNKLRTSDFQKNYYSNRSSLLQLHATSLANAYKFSYLFQRLNQTWNFADQPSLFYYYLGLTADVTANLGFMNGKYKTQNIVWLLCHCNCVFSTETINKFMWNDLPWTYILYSLCLLLL